MPTPKHHRLGLKQQLLVPVLEARKAKIKAPAHPVPRGGGVLRRPPPRHSLTCSSSCADTNATGGPDPHSLTLITSRRLTPKWC